VDAVLALPDFERFVFVLCLLERYPRRECALLLGCSMSQVQRAQVHAAELIANRDFQRFQTSDRFRRCSGSQPVIVTRLVEIENPRN
jgi:DNA-directed RNA polymerase specialized sigma24 family protein